MVVSFIILASNVFKNKKKKTMMYSGQEMSLAFWILFYEH